MFVHVTRVEANQILFQRLAGRAKIVFRLQPGDWNRFFFWTNDRQTE